MMYHKYMKLERFHEIIQVGDIFKSDDIDGELEFLGFEACRWAVSCKVCRGKMQFRTVGMEKIRSDCFGNSRDEEYYSVAYIVQREWFKDKDFEI